MELKPQFFQLLCSAASLSISLIWPCLHGPAWAGRRREGGQVSKEVGLAYQGCSCGWRTGQVNLACAGQQCWTGRQVGRSTLLTRAVVLGRRISRTRAEF